MSDILKPYGEDRKPIKVEGYTVSLSPKEWLTRDLQDFFLDSQMDAVKLGDFEVDGSIDFSKKADMGKIGLESSRISSEISKLQDPVEVKMLREKKSSVFSADTTDVSLYMFGLDTKIKANKADVGISKDSQLVGRAFLVPKASSTVSKLPSGYEAEKKYKDNNGNIVIYHEQIDDDGKKSYIKETIKVTQAQLVKNMGIEAKTGQPSRFVVVPENVTKNWDGKVGQSSEKDIDSGKGLLADLGDDRDSVNKNLLRGMALTYVFETELKEKAPIRIKEPKVVELPKKKVETKLPEFVDGSGKVYGYWKFKGQIPTAVVGDSRVRPFREAKKTQLASIKKQNKQNEKIEREIERIDEWLLANPGATNKQISDKQRRRAELVDKITEDRTMRIYAVENEGGNKKIDFYVYLGDERHAPKTADDFKTNSGVYKIRKAGFEIMNKTRTPVLEVYGKPHENESGKIVYDGTRRIVDVTRGGNEELNAFCDAFAKAEKDAENTTAFDEAFYLDKSVRKHISKELAEDLDRQKNAYYESVKGSAKVKKQDTSEMSKEDKVRAKARYEDEKARAKTEKTRAKDTSSGFKSGILKSGFLEKLATLAIGVGIGVGAMAIATQGVDIANSNQLRDMAETNAESHIAQVLEDDAVARSVSYNAFENETEPTLFNYKAENSADNIVIDSASESNIQKMFASDNATTFGYDVQKDVESTIQSEGWRNAARMAVSNWAGFDYSKEGVEGAYSALGSMAGQEVKENGVTLSDSEVVYPDLGTTEASFVNYLESLGASEEMATTAATAYANAFTTSYSLSEDLTTAPEEEPDNELDTTDGSLQETFSSIVGESVQVIHANYDETNNHGVIFGLDSDKNLVGVKFNNGPDFNIKVTNAVGFEAALLEAAAVDGCEIMEFKPVEWLNLSQSEIDKAYNYLGDVYGESAGLFYNVTPVKADNATKAHYGVNIVSVAEATLDVTIESVNVYPETYKTATEEDVFKTAVSEATDGKYAGASGHYTDPNEPTMETTIANELDPTTKAQAREALQEQTPTLNQGGVIPVSKESKEREK